MVWIHSLLGFIYDILFGCRHHRQTRPFTLERQTYKVCLDCGSKIYYSRERMTPLSAREVRRMKAAEAGFISVVPAANHGAMLVAEPAGKSNAAA
jgi:hypothetical protein